MRLAFCLTLVLAACGHPTAGRLNTSVDTVIVDSVYEALHARGFVIAASVSIHNGSPDTVAFPVSADRRGYPENIWPPDLRGPGWFALITNTDTIPLAAFSGNEQAVVVSPGDTLRLEISTPTLRYPRPEHNGRWPRSLLYAEDDSTFRAFVREVRRTGEFVYLPNSGGHFPPRTLQDTVPDAAQLQRYGALGERLRAGRYWADSTIRLGRVFPIE